MPSWGVRAYLGKVGSLAGQRRSGAEERMGHTIREHNQNLHEALDAALFLKKKVMSQERIGGGSDDEYEDQDSPRAGDS